MRLCFFAVVVTVIFCGLSICKAAERDYPASPAALSRKTVGDLSDEDFIEFILQGDPSHEACGAMQRKGIFSEYPFQLWQKFVSDPRLNEAHLDSYQAPFVAATGARIICSSYLDLFNAGKFPFPASRVLVDADITPNELSKILLPTLKSLEIEINLFKGEDDAFASVLEEYLPKCTSLTRLVIHKENLGPKSIRAVSRNLKFLPSLCIFHIYRTDLSVEAVSEIAEAIKTSSTLRELNIRTCSLEAEHMAVLAEALKGNETLENLHLCCNGFGPRGAAYLAEGLSGNTTLKQLYIISNDITNEGAQYIAKIIKTTTLEFFDISDNELSYDVGPMLDAALKENTSLKRFDMYNNSFRHDIEDSIRATIKANNARQ